MIQLINAGELNKLNLQLIKKLPSFFISIISFQELNFIDQHQKMLLLRINEKQ